MKAYGSGCIDPKKKKNIYIYKIKHNGCADTIQAEGKHASDVVLSRNMVNLCVSSRR
jgi:hypothetical protein